MYRAAFAIGILLLPLIAAAENHFVTRREGYLLIWDSIARPVEDTYESFADVPEGSPGARVIHYGKRRGMLDDKERFRPAEPLTLGDALLWIYRTRNIRELPDMQREDLPEMIADYPLVAMNERLDRRIEDTDELINFQQELDAMLAEEVHEVSFYADRFHGRGTAFGETFNMHQMTAAHRSLPHNTLVKVTNVENGRSAIVRINDRGPYVDGRDMDLSKAAFEQIAPAGQGVVRATFERLGHRKLVSRCDRHERRYQQRITRETRLLRGVPHDFAVEKQLVLQSSDWFVVRTVTFPDGVTIRQQNFVGPEEKYRFTPSLEGEYVFRIGDTQGRQREMRMTASRCVLPGGGTSF